MKGILTFRPPNYPNNEQAEKSTTYLHRLGRLTM